MNIGEKIPDFSLIDTEGNTISPSNYIGEKVQVIYFYPKDFSPGCTKEACSFRDAYQDFQDLGAVVIAISSDSIQSHRKFKEKHNLPFQLLSDPKGKVRKKFDVKKSFLGLLPGRETFVIDREGKLRYKFNTMQAKKHTENALKIVKEIMQ